MDKSSILFLVGGIFLGLGISFLIKRKNEKEVVPPSDVGPMLDYYRQAPLVGIGHSYWQSV